MEKVRGFEIAKGFEDKEINLPVRKTKYSAGYDVEAAEDCIIPSFKKGNKPTLVKTGIKIPPFVKDNVNLDVYTANDTFRATNVRIIKVSDTSNKSNKLVIFEIKEEDVEIKKGDAIGQAIFQKYLVTDDDIATGERTGGFGSTNK